MPPVFSPAELLSLPPSDLRDLVELADGDDLSVKLAVLGLDPEIPDHLMAVLEAFPELRTALDQVETAAQEGVRSDLTPHGPAPDGPDTGDPTAPEDGSGPFSGPAQLLDHMNTTRGTNTPFLAGTFALYAARDGSIVMVTETEQAGLRRDQLPARIVKLALGMASGKGGPLGMFGGMFGRG
jgi:hypothetical protein